MREVRPTISVIKRLPRESFTDPSVWDQIQNKDFLDLCLYGLDQPLLNDARKRFESGMPDRHISLTRAAGRPVYEVRSRTGAAWRGGVILDEHGDPWLVHADRHDQFHSNAKNSTAKNAFKVGNYLPIPAEYKIRDREDAEVAYTRWQSSLLQAVTETVTRAMDRQQTVRFVFAGHRSQDEVEFEVEIDHDQQADSPAEAHRSQSLITLVLNLRTRGTLQIRQEVLNTVLPFLQSNKDKHEPAYGPDGSLTLLIEVTQARLIQLAADVIDPQPPRPKSADPPDRFHYVGTQYLTAAFVEGNSVRGVCGSWFVPTRGDNGELPICARCEEELPIAERVLQLIGGQPG